MLRRQLALLAGWSLATYSLPAHKEFRFLLPALQLLMPHCGLAAQRLLSGSPPLLPALHGLKVQGSRQPQGSAAPGLAPMPRLRPQLLLRWGAAACLLLQLPMAAYFLLVHLG